MAVQIPGAGWRFCFAVNIEAEIQPDGAAGT